MSSRAARRSVTRIGGLAAALASGIALSLPTAAGAHYPYDLVPGWFAQTIGPAASATPECQLKEYFVGPHYGESGDTWSLSNFVNGEPVCRQVWGANGEQIRCGIYVASIHYPPAPPDFPNGYERTEGSGGCAVEHPYVSEEGETLLATDCEISLDVFSPAPASWTPRDCRAESLPGWPSSPYGEPLPADPAKKATCSVRKCTYELSCSNAFGVGGCDAFGLDFEAQFSDIATGPSAIALNQRQPVEMKTTVFGRQLIKRALKKGKRKINGWAELYATPAEAETESNDDPLDKQRLKIKLKR